MVRTYQGNGLCCCRGISGSGLQPFCFGDTWETRYIPPDTLYLRFYQSDDTPAFPYDCIMQYFEASECYTQEGKEIRAALAAAYFADRIPLYLIQSTPARVYAGGDTRPDIGYIFSAELRVHDVPSQVLTNPFACLNLFGAFSMTLGVCPEYPDATGAGWGFDGYEEEVSYPPLFARMHMEYALGWGTESNRCFDYMTISES